MDLTTALRQGVELLERDAVPEARLTAESLLLHAVKGSRVLLHTHPDREMGDLEQLHYARYLHERLRGRPLQYITGRREFWGREFRVDSSVLIPRPETEIVVERALAIAGEIAAVRIADCGTGSGCIAITMACELSEPSVVAIDVSAAALALASRNAQLLGSRAVGVAFLQGDLLEPLSSGTFDMVISNPPYVSLREMHTLRPEVRDFEPHVALFAGESGLEIHERLIPQAQRVLRPGGYLVLEIGYDQADPVRAMLGEWSRVEMHPDLAGIPRVVVARNSNPGARGTP